MEGPWGVGVDPAPWTRPAYVVSVSLRGPARKPSSISALLVGGADDRLAVDLLEREPLDRARAGRRRRARRATVDARVVGRRPAPAGPCRRARRTAPARRRRGRRRRPPARAGAARRLGPLQRRAVGLRGVGGGEHDRRRRVVVALRAQPLDRARERELRAAEALDEVAAAGDADRLQRRQRVVEGAEPARDALGQHLLAGDDAVALEQQLGLRAPAGGRILVARRTARAVSDQRPCTAGCAPPRGARRTSAGAWRARAATRRARRGQLRRAQRRERVVGRLARPHEVPQRRSAAPRS